MRLMSNSKGTHFLNVTELLISIVIIVIALVFLLASGKMSAQQQNEEVVLEEMNYKAAKLLNTYSYMTLKVEGSSTNVREAIRVITSQPDHYPQLSYTEFLRMKRDHKQALLDSAQDVFSQILLPSQTITLHLFTQDYEEFSMVLYEQKTNPFAQSDFSYFPSYNFNIGETYTLESFKETTTPLLTINPQEFVIEIPVYTGDAYEQPGDYNVYLALQQNKDLAKQKYTLQ